MVRRAVALALALVACSPHLDDRLFRVEGPRILAVVAEPAEAAPGTPIAYRALQVDASGEITDAIDWAFCAERAPLASLGSVSANCLHASGDAIVPFGAMTIDAAGALPVDACRLFGPEVPPAGQPGDPPGRPVDPDPTGGYYQPLRLIPEAGGEVGVTIERTRIQCGLASGTGEDRVAYLHRYRVNRNPSLSMLDLAMPNGTHVTIDTSAPPAPSQIPAGTVVTIRASWTECPGHVDDLPMDACAGAEPYLVYDGITEALVERRETMRLAWFATAGTIASDRTGREATDATTFSENTWTAPDTAGPVSLWIVLRDDRGGVGWFRIDLVVTI